MLSLQNPVGILDLQHISVWTSYVLSARQPHVASGCCIDECGLIPIDVPIINDGIFCLLRGAVSY